MSTHLHAHEKTKLQRIDLRVTSKIKGALTSAAELAGLSVSAFLIETAYERAKNLISEQETLKLSEAERDKFFILLGRESKPTTKLKSAMQKYLSRHKDK